MYGYNSFPFKRDGSFRPIRANEIAHTLGLLQHHPHESLASDMDITGHFSSFMIKVAGGDK